MPRAGLHANVVGAVLPRPMAALSVLTTGALGVVLAVGAVQFWTDPGASTGWRVFPLLGSIACLGAATMVFVAGVLRPRIGLERLRRRTVIDDGMTIHGSRAVQVVALAVASVWLLCALVGAAFASGGWRIGLVILAALLGVAVAGGVVSVSRPRYLRLTERGIEASSQRCTAELRWEDIGGYTVALSGGGGGSNVIRVFAVDPARVTFTSRNPFERGVAAVDIDLGALGIEAERLGTVLEELRTDRTARARLTGDPASLQLRLASSW